MTIPSDSARGAKAPRDRNPLQEELRQALRGLEAARQTSEVATKTLSEAGDLVRAAVTALGGYDGDLNLPNPRDGTLITVGEAARLLKCSEKTIRRRMKGEPDLVRRIGRKRMVVREVLLAGRPNVHPFG